MFHENILPYHSSQPTDVSNIFPQFKDAQIHDCDDHYDASRTIATQNQLSTLQPAAIREEQHQTTSPHISAPPRRSTREHKTPSYLSEYVCNTAHFQPEQHQAPCCPHTVTSIRCNASLTCDSLPDNKPNLPHPSSFYSEPLSYEEVASKTE